MKGGVLNMMKFQKIVMFMFLMTISFAPMLVKGETYYEPGGNPNAAFPTSIDQMYKPDNANVLISKIVNFILGAIVFLSILFIVIGGVMYIISAGGDTERAKNMIFNAIIGLTVALLGYAIVLVVGSVVSE